MPVPPTRNAPTLRPPGPAFTTFSEHAAHSTPARQASSSVTSRAQNPSSASIPRPEPSAASPAPQYNQRELDYLNSLQTSNPTSQPRSAWVTRAASTQFNSAAINASLAQQQQQAQAQAQPTQQSPSPISPSRNHFSTSPNESPRSSNSGEKPIDFSSVTQSPFDDLEAPPTTSFKPLSASSGLSVNAAVVAKRQEVSGVRKISSRSGDSAFPTSPSASASNSNSSLAPTSQSASASPALPARSLPSAPSASTSTLTSSSNSASSAAASASASPPISTRSLNPSNSSSNLPPPPKPVAMAHSGSASSVLTNPSTSATPSKPSAPSVPMTPSPQPQPISSTLAPTTSTSKPSLSSVLAPQPQSISSTLAPTASTSKPSASSVQVSAPSVIPPLPAPPSPTQSVPNPSSSSSSSSASSLPFSSLSSSSTSTSTTSAATMQSLPSNPVWPRVQLLSCGGTIAQKSSDDGRGMILNAHPPAELLAQTQANVNWSQRTICQSSGAAMSFQNVFALRDHVVDAQNEFDGFVITTGTDSGEEVAFLLDRLLFGHVKIAVVVTGAMKPSDISGYDGPANVEAAARVAVNSTSKSLGVLFVENNAIHAARYVVKSDSTRIGAFHSRCGGPLGFVRGGRVIFHYTALPPLAYSVPLSINDSHLSRLKVAIWTMTLDAYFPEIMLHEVDGLVVAGQGTGSISNSVLNTLASYTSSVRMAMATRCETGSNFDDFYYKGSLDKYEKLGIEVAAFEGLSPQQTRLALMLNMATGLS